MLILNLGEGQANNTMTYDTITKGLDMKIQHKYELEYKGQLFPFQDITYHRLIKGSN